MTKRAIWQIAAFLALSVALAGWAAAHGKKDWPAPEEAKKLKNPVTASDASISAGKALYLDNCAQCHGEQGKGDGTEAGMYNTKPADFTDAHMMGEMTDGEIFWKISEGRRPMPSFKKRFREEQRWDLVNYIRTFASKAAPETKLPGDGNKKPAPRKHSSSRLKSLAEDLPAQEYAAYFTAASASATSPISGNCGMSYCLNQATLPCLSMMAMARPVMPLSSRNIPYLPAIAPRGWKSASSG